jgi:hypothetical protein
MKEEEKQYPKTFEELFANTSIKPKTDENGNTNWNFKATMKEETNLKKHLDSCKEYQGPRRSAIVDKQETLEEAAERLYPEEWDWKEREIFIAGAKWMQERMYSEEDMTEYAIYIVFNNLITPKQWFEQFKKK